MRTTILWTTLALVLTACNSAPGTAPVTAPPAAPATATAPATPTATVGGTPSASAPAAVGQMVDIGGRSLYLVCQGQGQPTVILEAGLTGDLATWGDVMPALPANVRVCSYDRANIKPSDPAPTPRTARDMVADLDALLAKASIAPPYVLVGFSFGGLVAQMFAGKHPTTIAGLVLVESNHPKEVEQFEAHLTPAQIKEDRAAVNDNPEGVDLYASFDQAKAAGRLPAVPLVVVTATVSEGWPPDWDTALFDKLRADQQKDLATFVPGGRQVFAEGSSHMVPEQRPDVIVDAIRTVLAAKA